MTEEQKARGALWDMDGTLLDSADLHWLSWQEALGAAGLPVTKEQFTSTFGQRNDEILHILYGNDLTAEQVRDIGDAKEASYRALVRQHHIEPLPGVRGWLARLHAAGWRQAVASSAPIENIDAVLAALDLAQYFDAAAAARDVRVGKPDPEVYLVAAQKLGLPPTRCLVVEDAPAGVEGAHRAGMRAIAVGPNAARLGADLAAPSLAELPPDAFDRLLNQAEVSLTRG